MKNIFTISLFIFFCVSAYGRKPADMDSLYMEGKYKEALAGYTSLLDQGKSSSALYYNIGNCYYKLGENTKAIIFYERALKLDPADKSVRYNLEMARKLTVDKIAVLPEVFFVRIYKNMVRGISVDGWAVMSVISLLVFLVMLSVFLFSRQVLIKKIGFYVGIVSIFFMIWTFSTAYDRYRDEKYNVKAIITAPSVTLKGSPDNSGTELFVVHEGLKVQVISTLGEWCNVRLQDGNEGWIKLVDIEKI